jgi:hypothetical protein
MQLYLWGQWPVVIVTQPWKFGALVLCIRFVPFW